LVAAAKVSTVSPPEVGTLAGFQLAAVDQLPLVPPNQVQPFWAVAGWTVDSSARQTLT
jgi:hypothetical protein